MGRGVLQGFAAMLGGVHETEALNELLSCLMARSWELDDEAQTAREAGSARPQRIFDRAWAPLLFASKWPAASMSTSLTITARHQAFLGERSQRQASASLTVVSSWNDTEIHV